MGLFLLLSAGFGGSSFAVLLFSSPAEHCVYHILGHDVCEYWKPHWKVRGSVLGCSDHETQRQVWDCVGPLPPTRHWASWQFFGKIRSCAEKDLKFFPRNLTDSWESKGWVMVLGKGCVFIPSMQGVAIILIIIMSKKKKKEKKQLGPQNDLLYSSAVWAW